MIRYDLKSRLSINWEKGSPHSCQLALNSEPELHTHVCVCTFVSQKVASLAVLVKQTGYCCNPSQLDCEQEILHFLCQYWVFWKKLWPWPWNTKLRLKIIGSSIWRVSLQTKFSSCSLSRQPPSYTFQVLPFAHHYIVYTVYVFICLWADHQSPLYVRYHLAGTDLPFWMSVHQKLPLICFVTNSLKVICSDQPCSVCVEWLQKHTDTFLDCILKTSLSCVYVYMYMHCHSLLVPTRRGCLWELNHKEVSMQLYGLHFHWAVYAVRSN